MLEYHTLNSNFAPPSVRSIPYLYFTRINISGSKSIVIKMSVRLCLPVCPLLCLRNHTSKLHQIFRICTCWLKPWLDPLWQRAT